MPYHSKFLRCAVLILLGGMLVMVGYFVPTQSAAAEQTPLLTQCQGCHQGTATTFLAPNSPCDECHEVMIDSSKTEELNHQAQYLASHLEDTPHKSHFWTVTTSLKGVTPYKSWRVLRLSEALWQVLQKDTSTQKWAHSNRLPLPLLGVLVSLRELQVTVIHLPLYQLPDAPRYWLPLLHAVFTLLALFLMDVSHRRAPPQEDGIHQFIQMVKRALASPYQVCQRSFSV